MSLMSSLWLFSLGSLLRMDILVWLFAVPALVAFVLLLLWQLRQHSHLKEELVQLSKLKRHAVEYDLVMKAMKVGVWRIDIPTNTITYESDYRESADSMVLPPGSDVKLFTDKVAPEYRGKLASDMQDLLDGRIDEFHEQFQLILPPDGHIGWGETYAVVEKRDLEGNPLVLVGASMRIDHQKAIEQALIDARNHAEESDRLKSAFLANISHEIRTPLNAIVGFSDVLTMAQSDEERNELIALIKQNNAHLLHLFDGMVSMSKLEAGGGMVKKTRFELNMLLAEIADKYAAEAFGKGLQVSADIQPDTPVLYTDRDRLTEILTHYMDNALKFTSKGSVTMGYTPAGNRLRIWVRDTGKGIPADRLDDRLFERFVKVDDFVPGTGLGLSICRSQALSLGGTVGVESKLGEGSLFWVELPVD